MKLEHRFSIPAAGAPTAAAAEPATSGRRERQVTTAAALPVTDEIDLLDTAGGAVGKRRLIPVAGALGLLVLVIVYWLRRR